MKKLLAVVLMLAMMLPAAGLAAELPFGLAIGMDADQTVAAFAADATLKDLKYETNDYGEGSLCYVFGDVDALGTGLVATSMEVQVDSNNSAGDMKLTSLSFVLDSDASSIASFRTLLGALKATFGEPEADPFADVDTYVEWGTLYATWTTDDLRVSLSLARMYEDSVMLNYASRKNYDPADLAE